MAAANRNMYYPRERMPRTKEDDVAPNIHIRPPPISKVRGKAAPQYLQRGTFLSHKYKIEKMIGGGGFGQIYRATDVNSGIVVAVKVEPESEEAGRMVLEQIVLSRLLGTRHSPNIFYAGALNGYNFIVMQMLGRNLTEMRKMTRNKRLSVHTVVRVGLQMMEALENVHNIGYLHRDVKPSNMCTGIGEHRRIIYLVDFGMTRQYRKPSGEWRRERQYAAFRGTMRYVSISVHERQEQGPVDDLWSLYYTLIELAEGSLPWRNVTEHDEIMMMKKHMLYPHFTPVYLPRYFAHLTFQLIQTAQNQVPKYEEMRDILRHCCKRVDEDADFEWDDEKSTQSDD